MAIDVNEKPKNDAVIPGTVILREPLRFADDEMFWCIYSKFWLSNHQGWMARSPDKIHAFIILDPSAVLAFLPNQEDPESYRCDR